MRPLDHQLLGGIGPLAFHDQGADRIGLRARLRPVEAAWLAHKLEIHRAEFSLAIHREAHLACKRNGECRKARRQMIRQLRGKLIKPQIAKLNPRPQSRSFWIEKSLSFQMNRMIIEIEGR